MAVETAMPQNVRIRLNVGGTSIHTSLYTVMEGARQGGVIFRCLCVQILGPGPAPPGPREAVGGQSSWESRVVPAQTEQYHQEHFVDADPTPFPYWLDYLRSGQVRFVEVGRLREQVRMHLCVFMYMCVCIYMCTCIHVLHVYMYTVCADCL